MIYIFAAHPHCMRTTYPWLRRLERERKVLLASYNEHRGYCGRTGQVILVHPNAISQTQVITTSIRSDYSHLASYMHAHCDNVAYLFALPSPVVLS